jgi:mono/diheme cytochrome c family protein
MRRLGLARGIAALVAALGCCALLAAPATADPRVDYMLNCRGCHGPDGAGAPGAAPSFRGQLAKFLWVPGGREYLVRVPGTAQSELDDARTAALLNWLLHEFSAAEIPAGFTPYGADEVAPLRHAPLADVWGTRSQLLRVLAAQTGEAAPSPVRAP